MVESSSQPTEQEVNSDHISQSSKEVKNKRKQVGGAGSRKKHSIVWEHFETYIDKDDGVQRARCLHCTHVYYADPSKNGITSLRQHIPKCPNNPQNKKDLQVIQSQLTFGGRKIDELTEKVKASLHAWKFDQTLVRNAISYMIIVDELPFRFVEGKGFQYLMSVACPVFSIPSRTTITRDCYKLYLDEKIKLKSFIKNVSGRICLTTDTWTSKQKECYMCLTAHFIDNDWNMHKRILNFCPISSHKGSDIGELIYKCLLDWGINNVFTVTVDNTSSNDTAILYLKRKFMNWSNCILGGKMSHVRCLAHILNLIVKDGLKTTSESVDNVRAAIKYIKMSPSRIEKFKEVALLENIEYKKHLSLDVSTRWNSTYTMITSCLDYTRVFQSYAEKHSDMKESLKEDGHNVPSSEDWNNAKNLCDYLECFYHVTNEVSGSKYVTSNEFVSHISEIDGLIKELKNSSDSQICLMAYSMGDKFEKYWGDVSKMNKIVFMTVVMDPRRKLGYLSFMLTNMYENDIGGSLYISVKRAIEDMYDDYKRLYGSGDSSVKLSYVSSCSSSRDVSASDETNSYVCARNRENIKHRLEKQYQQSKTNVVAESTSELQLYLAEADHPYEKEFDILSWWRKNKARFPILSEMARDLLAIPLSTVASESAFSTGGRVLDFFRSSLTPRIVQALICAQDWFRVAESPIKVEENLLELQNFETDLNPSENPSEKDCTFFDNL